MRTRCPVCSTVFRVTSEQLRLKAGKVRCGHCQGVFNAFDALLSDQAPTPEVVTTPAGPSIESLAPAVTPATERPSPTLVRPEPSREPLPAKAPAAAQLEPSGAAALAAREPDEILAELEAALVPGAAVSNPPEAIVSPVLATPETPRVEPIRDSMADLAASPASETPEESTLAAREAGLVAARELNERPTYNRWAEGTLANSNFGGFDTESQQRAAWPFVLVALLLGISLLGQLLYAFRTEIVQRVPGFASVFALAAVDVPLPRNSDWVAIESSDLQSDNGRGLFILQALLHNRASYSQAWPALELTLTDTSDTVVSRRVLLARDYLPPATDSSAFPDNGEVAIKLWIEARNIGAAGYRLYIFYP